MLSSAVYPESYPRRSAAFASPMNRRDASPPTTGFSVPTTPTDPTGTSYPFSFQSLAKPYSPSCSNGTSFISFRFILLWTLSLTTDGYTPSPKKVQRRFDLVGVSSLIMDQGSRITNRGPDSAPRAQNRRTNCALSCPEPGRGVCNNSFLPRAAGRGACHMLAPKGFAGCVFHGGGVGVG